MFRLSGFGSALKTQWRQYDIARQTAFRYWRTYVDQGSRTIRQHSMPIERVHVAEQPVAQFGELRIFSVSVCGTPQLDDWIGLDFLVSGDAETGQLYDVPAQGSRSILEEELPWERGAEDPKQFALLRTPDPIENIKGNLKLVSHHETGGAHHSFLKVAHPIGSIDEIGGSVVVAGRLLHLDLVDHLPMID